MKLFLVKCRGMKVNSTGTPHGIAYVLANDPNEAYKKLRKYLDENDLGFRHERELESIELLAENTDYPECRIRLLV